MASSNSSSAALPLRPTRRAFLSGSIAGLNPRLARIPAERIALLKEIAQRWEHRLPKGAIPQLRATDACAGHSVCASVCPTGALRSFGEAGVQGLEFDAPACFACGACVVVCPEKALRLEARDSGRPQALAERITRHALRVCSRCDDEFTVSGESELCPACRKDVGLFTNGFSAGSDET